MLDAVHFFRRHAIPAFGAPIGAGIVLAGYGFMTRDIVQLGLPIAAWQGIGAAIFFASVFVLLYRWDRDHHRPAKASSEAVNATAPMSASIHAASIASTARPAPMYPNSILIADLQMNLGRISHASPWLDFHGIGFNGSFEPIRILSASGRVRVAAVEFPSNLELSTPGFVVEAYSLFTFNLSLPLNDRGAEFLTKFEHDMSVIFSGAKLVFTLFATPVNPEALPRYDVLFPERIAFHKTGSIGEPQPRFLVQVMQR